MGKKGLAFTNNARFGVALRDCHIINIRRAFLVGAKEGLEHEQEIVREREIVCTRTERARKG